MSGMANGGRSEAREMLSRCKDDEQEGVTWGVISKLVDGRSVGPVRFRM